MARQPGRSDPQLLAAHGSDPDWSPDGTELAYSGAGHQVIIVNADGTGPRVVTSGYDPAWSPDGKSLAVVDRSGISIVDIDGQNRRLVIPHGTEPDWSPYGTQLVLAGGNFSENAVVIANADGTDERQLVGPDFFAPSPSWSPSGTEIAFTGPAGCGTRLSNDNTSNICEIAPDGTDEHQLPTHADYYRSGYTPAWGPTPSDLVFGWTDTERGDGDSHLVLWPGMRQITMASPPTIIVSSQNGRTVGRITPGGSLLGLAVTTDVVAALVHEPNGGWAVEIYEPRPRVVRLAAVPQDELVASGTTLAFQVGHAIDVLDASRGSPRRVATTDTPSIGLSIVGDRIAWAESLRGGARIRAIELQ